MRFNFTLLRFDPNQKRTISEIFVDIGKLFFAGGVVGFFIPGITGKINIGTFIFALILSLVCFTVGVKLAKKNYYYEY